MATSNEIESAGKGPSGEGKPWAGSGGAPAWVVPLYVGGLIVFYVGEKVLPTLEGVRVVVSGIGLCCVLVATATRFAPTWQAGGARARIERLFGVLSLIGVAGLVIYFATTEWGLSRLGLAAVGTELRERITGPLTIAWVCLVLVSVVPMLFAEVALYPMRNADRLESRRVEEAAVSGITLAVAVIYGSVLVFAASLVESQVDFSYFKTSEPSESTRKVLSDLREPIRLTAFFPEVSPARKEVENYLRKLGKDAPNLKWVFADRYLDPKLASDLDVVRDGVIVVQKGEAKRTMIVGTEMEEAQPKLRTLDRDFQYKLIKLLRDYRSAYLTVGHGEINDEDEDGQRKEGRGGNLLRHVLVKQHYEIRRFGLTKGLASDVPEGADIVMILGPTRPFAPEEIRALERYAKRGGKLFMALDPEAVSGDDLDLIDSSEAATVKDATEKAPAPIGSVPTVPSSGPPGSGPPGQTTLASVSGGGSAHKGLDALASIVGLQFDATILADEKQYVRRRYDDSDRRILITNRFSSHASVSTLSRNSARAAVLVSGAGFLEKAKTGTTKTDVTLRAVSTTFNDVNQNYRFDASTEKQSSFGLAYAVSQPVAKDAAKASSTKPRQTTDKIDAIPTPDEMRAFVVADADAFSDVVLQNFVTNQLFLADALRWLGGEESFAGETTTEEDVRLEHTQQKDLVWFYTTIFGAPALVLGVGLLIMRRRPRRRGP